VLVLHDLLAIHEGFQPKFVKRYAHIKQDMVRGVGEYAADVRARRFPGPEHAYGIAPEEMERLRAQLPQRRATPA
jgi:3-methyl-2-oxobutanoate hydroxymethyltransferase